MIPSSDLEVEDRGHEDDDGRDNFLSSQAAMDCDLLDFELWYEATCASIDQAPSPLPQHLSPSDWEVLLSMFDTPGATGSAATAACREMAGGHGSQGPGQDIVASLQHSTQTQLGATSDHIHDVHSSGSSSVPLQSSSRYSPYNFSARLNAPRNRSRRAHLFAAADGDLMMEHDHNLTADVPTMSASLLPPAPPSLLPTPASLPPAPASLPPASASLPPVPASLPPPPTIGSLTTSAIESSSSLAGRFGLEDLPQVKLEAKDILKRSTFDNSFLLSTKARTKKALESLATVVAEYNSPELTQWANGSEASKDAETIAHTVKNLRKKIQDIVRIAVVYGYNLHEALATQPQAEIVRIIDQLLDNDAFLNGSINVGGQMIVVPFGHSALRYFIKHILFYNLNFQHFRWDIVSVGTSGTVHRIAVDEGLYNVYTALSSEGSVRKSGIAASASRLNDMIEFPDSHFSGNGGF
ncbi:uncharacterized protein F5891DRAFT_977938 [Suillus fuscotomentosus]|uniref:Uncharacterized protein n=1 Tax=Suillus fuscotomentosus TaxID=1912939 RepID=A0AAD4HNV7_9AGAM|nr:uncharacterized protein F5891DRAFT_977938 [Suillus fuscotomentosus]KAG1903372.1 hypothetical protein F5891DRAFT_977938 [Suillus fuscotomentosus]